MTNHKKKKTKKATATSSSQTMKTKSDSSLSVSSENTEKTATITKLLDRAETLVAELQFDLAEKFCKKAASVEADNERVLTTMGILYVEMGNLELARENLEKAVSLYPNAGYSKYLYLSQLLGGKEAVDCYEKALLIMNSVKGSADASDLSNSDISSVYCALAELYLTDLCETENASEHCENYLREAVKNDPENPEVFQTFASFLISAERKDEAVAMLKKGTDLWLPSFVELMDDEIGEASAMDCSLDFDARKSCAKLAIELEQYETAEHVLSSLLAENDTDIETWYLFGWCSYLQGSEKYSTAKAYLNQSLELYRKSKHSDRELLQHVEQLLDEIGDVADEVEDDADWEDDNDETMQIAKDLDAEEEAEETTTVVAPKRRRRT